MIRSLIQNRSTAQASVRVLPVCYQQKQPYSKGFIKSLIDKIKEESNRDEQLKESIKKFREESAKLEQSKELKSVREFYKKLEKEVPSDAVGKVKGAVGHVSEWVREGSQRLTSNEALQKNLSQAKEQMKGATKMLGQNKMFQATLKSVAALERELESDRSKVYEPLKTLRTRAEVAGTFEEKMISPDSESSGVVVHKDSKWHTAWQDFKDSNQYVQKFFDLKMQYEESDHPLARSFRFVTDRVAQLVGGGSSSTELQTTMDEITKMDPEFTVEKFLNYCRFVAIPNVLEAFIRWDFNILNDWCHEAAYGMLTSQVKDLKNAGYVPCNKILDISHLDIHTAKMTEQGPILVIFFQTQEIRCVRDLQGKVHSGDPHKVLRVTNVWALCRNQHELHPWTAWRVLEAASAPSEQWL